MLAAWYERAGPASEVLHVGDMPDPEPGDGEVRIRLTRSGVNPGDVKKRGDWVSLGMPYPRIIPHGDGAGVIDKIGSSVHDRHVGQRVWMYGAQSYRPFGTAAQLITVPADQAVPLPDEVSDDVGACLGIPASLPIAPCSPTVPSPDTPSSSRASSGRSGRSRHRSPHGAAPP